MPRYTTILSIPDFDEATIKDARVLFLQYKKDRVILNCDFQDNKWNMSDEYSNVTFDFNVKRLSDYGEYLSITKEQFIEYMKTYAVFRLGELSLRSIQEIIRLIKRVVQYPVGEIKKIADDLNSAHMNRVEEFFSMFPDKNDKISIIMDSIVSISDELRLRPTGGQRQLAAFDSYFKFNDILDRFWNETADEQEKLFYFPVFLWWNLTGIIPTRPREFIVTPRNCLIRNGSHNYITLRKDQLKGSTKKASYKIERDYRIAKYEITDSLADEIQWYIEKTEDAIPSEIGTLFRTDSHYLKWDRVKPWNSRYFTYANLATCLRYFFKQIVKEKYGYTILFERDKNYLEENEIQYLSLGDTRHISLINIIASGATPMVAQLLAGQEDPNMASHYYSNITSLIECKTYRQFKRLTGKEVAYSLSKKQKDIKSKLFAEVENGRCYSEKTIKGDYTDCYNVAGPSGEIGFCEKCMYYRSNDGSNDIYKNMIYEECAELDRLIRKLRQGKGESEDIMQALLRLRANEFSYQQYLLETMEGNHDK